MIKKLCYELYKIDWKHSHMITHEREMDSIKDYYQEVLTDNMGDIYSYENFLEKHGYSGELYVCFDEFCENEYLDETYMHFLLDNEQLISLYNADVNKDKEDGAYKEGNMMHMKISDMMKQLQDIQDKYGDIEVYIHDSNDGYDTFGISIYADEAPTEDDTTYAVIGMDSTAENTNIRESIKVKLPNGYLMVETKGTVDDYPGVYISYSENRPCSNLDNIIACVEYDTCMEEIKTETYQKDVAEPKIILCWADGREVC